MNTLLGRPLTSNPAICHPLSSRRFALVHRAAEADVICPKGACGSFRRLSATPLCSCESE